MSFINKSMAKKTNGNPLPSRVSKLLREARWFVLIGVALYLTMIFYSYDQTDPSWSHSGDLNQIRNAGGYAGAWLADLLLYLFGISAWWSVIFFTCVVSWSYRHLDISGIFDKRSLLLSAAGFIILLTASSGLESLRFYTINVSLPRVPGGMLGEIISNNLSQAIGFTGATLTLLILIAIGFSLFTGLSWVRFVEKIGETIENCFSSIIKFWQAQQDKRLGVVLSQKSKKLVGDKTKYAEDVEEYLPLHVKLATTTVSNEPPATIVSSKPPTIVDPDRLAAAITPDKPPAAIAPDEPPAAITPDKPPAAIAPDEPPAAITPDKPAAAITPDKPAAAIAPKPSRIIKEKQTTASSEILGSSLPPLHLLDEPQQDVEVVSQDMLEFTSRLIERKLKEFGVEVSVVTAYPGPVITRYEIEPAVGVKGSQIINLIKDLARALSVASIRVVETIPGKTYMGLEIPNPKRQMVRLSEVLSSQAYTDKSSVLTIALGKDISGRPVVSDLAKMPHALVAGTTGSGKSVAINAIILSLIYKTTPDQVRLILVDPKMLELSVYEGIPHLLAPVVTDMSEASNALRWCVAEMERRYKLMSSLGVRNLDGYNQKIRDAIKQNEPLLNPLTADTPEYLEELPLIVVVIDELADMMMVVGKKVEHLIARLAQKARAAGIHLLLATQRPSVDVITGLIKANIPTRIAFQVSSKIDSRTILDQMGAEALLGQGDMLYLPPGSGYPQRVHGAYVADHEVHKVVEYLKEHGEACYVEEILNTSEEESEVANHNEQNRQARNESDPLYDEAVAMVIKTRRASISLVQRNLRIGYNRAARLIEEMERTGLVSAMQSNGNREVLVPSRNE
ncbi:DNA translocase FtsK [Nitrosomonas cryotolerans]|nr:DNA translocase FtsK [Nitrosomonas cryotolerans]